MFIKTLSQSFLLYIFFLLINIHSAYSSSWQEDAGLISLDELVPLDSWRANTNDSYAGDNSISSHLSNGNQSPSVNDSISNMENNSTKNADVSGFMKGMQASVEIGSRGPTYTADELFACNAKICLAKVYRPSECEEIIEKFIDTDLSLRDCPSAIVKFTEMQNRLVDHNADPYMLKNLHDKFVEKTNKSLDNFTDWAEKTVYHFKQELNKLDPYNFAFKWSPGCNTSYCSTVNSMMADEQRGYVNATTETMLGVTDLGVYIAEDYRDLIALGIYPDDTVELYYDNARFFIQNSDEALANIKENISNWNENLNSDDVRMKVGTFLKTTYDIYDMKSDYDDLNGLQKIYNSNQ